MWSLRWRAVSDWAGDVSRGKILLSLSNLVIELRFVLEGDGEPLKAFRCWGDRAVLCFRVLFLHGVGRGRNENMEIIWENVATTQCH